MDEAARLAGHLVLAIVVPAGVAAEEDVELVLDDGGALTRVGRVSGCVSS